RKGLVDAICTLLEDAELAREMGQAGRAHVEATFSAQELPTPLTDWIQIRS
ncbi:MAG: hypothetical protein QOH90_1427, partial [Actinomycetota bacterium]|nr:hypothetical protein [Actinomycetota bacterium]